MAMFSYHRKAKFDYFRKRLDKLKPPKTPGAIEYIALWGDPELDREYREARGLPPIDYSGPFVAEWGKADEKEIS